MSNFYGQKVFKVKPKLLFLFGKLLALIRSFFLNEALFSIYVLDHKREFASRSLNTCAISKRLTVFVLEV
jgi:hypothetical protein